MPAGSSQGWLAGARLGMVAISPSLFRRSGLLQLMTAHVKTGQVEIFKHCFLIIYFRSAMFTWAPSRSRTVSQQIVTYVQEVLQDRGHAGSLSYIHLCSYYKSSLQGDSGGSLIAQDRDLQGWTAVGLVSYQPGRRSVISPLHISSFLSHCIHNLLLTTL